MTKKERDTVRELLRWIPKLAQCEYPFLYIDLNIAYSNAKKMVRARKRRKTDTTLP